MTSLRSLAASLILCASASSAAASPIAFAGGQLDGTLRFFTSATATHTEFTYGPAHDYVLGIDFFPGVPLYNLQNLVLYDACVLGPPSFPCINAVSSLNPAGEENFGQGAFADGVLGDGCGPLSDSGFVFSSIALVARGNCAFDEKWDNAQAAGYVGVLVSENDLLQPVAGVGLSGFPGLTIPFMRVTLKTAQEISTRIPFFDGDTGALIGRIFPAVEMRVSWTPDIQAVPVPEPTSLVLVISGGVGLLAKARRRSRRAMNRLEG